MTNTLNRTDAAKRAASMRELSDQGLTLAEIGARFGVCRQRVFQIVGPTGQPPGRRRPQERSRAA